MLGAPARKTALCAAISEFVLSLLTFLSYDKGQGGFQFLSSTPIVPEWKLSYAVGADGLSLVMLLLTGIVTLAAVWVTPKIEKRENLFYALVLLITAGAAGAFASTDLFFFYAFHELALIPTFLLIGLVGDRRALHGRVEDHHLFGARQLHPAHRSYRSLPRRSGSHPAPSISSNSSVWPRTELFLPPRRAGLTFSC